MIIIYSDQAIKGLSGMYISPRFFDGSCERCETVYTNKPDIKQAYTDKGIEVKGFPRTSAPSQVIKPEETEII